MIPETATGTELSVVLFGCFDVLDFLFSQRLVVNGRVAQREGHRVELLGDGGHADIMAQVSRNGDLALGCARIPSILIDLEQVDCLS